MIDCNWVQGILDVRSLLAWNVALILAFVATYIGTILAGRRGIEVPTAACSGHIAANDRSSSWQTWRTAVGVLSVVQTRRAARRVTLLVVGTFLLSPLLQVGLHAAEAVSHPAACVHIRHDVVSALSSSYSATCYSATARTSGTSSSIVQALHCEKVRQTLSVCFKTTFCRWGCLSSLHTKRLADKLLNHTAGVFASDIGCREARCRL